MYCNESFSSRLAPPTKPLHTVHVATRPVGDEHNTVQVTLVQWVKGTRGPDPEFRINMTRAEALALRDALGRAAFALERRDEWLRV